MAKDDNGVEPRAKDGEPDPPSLEELRRARAQAKADADDETAVAAVNGKRGSPIDDQPDDGEAEEMFPAGSIDGDHQVTMKNIVPAGKQRKTEAKMSAAAVPLRDGLMRYGRLCEVLVTIEAGKVQEVPELEEQDSTLERKLLGVKDVQHFRVVHVRSAAGMYTLDQVLDVLEKHFGVPRTADKVAEVFGLTAAA